MLQCVLPKVVTCSLCIQKQNVSWWPKHTASAPTTGTPTHTEGGNTTISRNYFSLGRVNLSIGNKILFVEFTLFAAAREIFGCFLYVPCRNFLLQLSVFQFSRLSMGKKQKFLFPTRGFFPSHCWSRWAAVLCQMLLLTIRIKRSIPELPGRNPPGDATRHPKQI